MSCCWTSTGCALAPRTDHAVSAIYFTLAGIVLYLAADWVLERIEIRRGERLEHRTLVFFVCFVLYYFVNWKYLSEIWPLR